MHRNAPLLHYLLALLSLHHFHSRLTLRGVKVNFAPVESETQIIPEMETLLQSLVSATPWFSHLEGYSRSVLVPGEGGLDG